MKHSLLFPQHNASLSCWEKKKKKEEEEEQELTSS